MALILQLSHVSLFSHKYFQRNCSVVNLDEWKNVCGFAFLEEMFGSWVSWIFWVFTYGALLGKKPRETGKIKYLFENSVHKKYTKCKLQYRKTLKLLLHSVEVMKIYYHTFLTKISWNQPFC